MAWQDRLKEAAYTSPSGTRLTFDFVDVRRTFSKKTAGFQFPDSDETYVQDNGVTSFQFPLRVYFSGDDYDIAAANFETALSERGIGKLEHPMYGVFDAVPFGSITRRDDLVTAANQAVIELVFWQSIRSSFPTSQQDPASAVAEAINEFNSSAATSFNNSVEIVTSVEKISFENSYKAALNSVTNALQPVADTTEAIQSQFDGIYDSIDLGLETLIGDPITLALQTIQLIQSPARAAAAINTKLTVYGSLIGSILGINNEGYNEFQGAKLYANGCVSAQVVSVLNTTFDTRPQALQAAEDILKSFDDVNEWSETNYTAFENIDTGGDYQKLQEAVALAAGFLVELSFDLREERLIVLDRNRTIIDLVAELYGSIDDQLDFFIRTNNLSGSEILELKKGRQIVYYI